MSELVMFPLEVKPMPPKAELRLVVDMESSPSARRTSTISGLSKWSEYDGVPKSRGEVIGVPRPCTAP
jgi:hypothetical protein